MESGYNQKNKTSAIFDWTEIFFTTLNEHFVNVLRIYRFYEKKISNQNLKLHLKVGPSCLMWLIDVQGVPELVIVTFSPFVTNFNKRDVFFFSDDAGLLSMSIRYDTVYVLSM